MLLHYFNTELEKISATATKTNPALWERSKSEAKAKMGGKHSARAMQLATQIYKKKGGGYSGAKPTSKNNSLKKWGKQKWQWSKEKKASKGVYLPAAKIARLKSSPEGQKKLRSAERKKAIATSRGEQYSSHGLAANTSLKKTAMDKRSLKKIIRQLRKSVVAHGKQADTLSKMVKTSGDNYIKKLAMHCMGKKKGGKKVKKKMTKKASVRKDVMDAFKAEGGALGTKALMKHTKKHSPKDVMKEVKALKSEGKIKQHVHGDMYTPMSKEASIEYRGKTFPGYGKPIASDRKNKKKMVLVKRGDKVKVVHFGHKGYQDFTQHKDKKRRKNYLTRSAGIKNKSGQLTKNDPFSPNYWARRELW